MTTRPSIAIRQYVGSGHGAPNRPVASVEHRADAWRGEGLKVRSARFLSAVVLAGGAVLVLSSWPTLAGPVGPTVRYVDDDMASPEAMVATATNLSSVIRDAVDAAAPYDTIAGVWRSRCQHGQPPTHRHGGLGGDHQGAQRRGSAVTLHDASHIDLHWFSIVAGTTAPLPRELAGLGKTAMPRIAHVRGNHAETRTDAEAAIAGASSSASTSADSRNRSWAGIA